MKREAKRSLSFSGLAVIMIAAVFFAGCTKADDRAAKEKVTTRSAHYLGTQLNSAYRAVVVLAPLSQERGEETIYLYGEPDMLAADGKPIEAGKCYVMGKKGLRLMEVSPSVFPEVK